MRVLRAALAALALVVFVVAPGARAASAGQGRLAFTDGGVLHVIGADGSNERIAVAPKGSYASDLAWAPSGRTIAYTRSTNSAPVLSQIVVSDATLTKQRVVIGDPGTIVSEPTWSPDGRRLAFIAGVPVGYFGFGYQAHVWVVNADGTGRRIVATLPGAARWLSWSPKGSTVAFVADGLETGGAVALVDVDAVPPRPRIVSPRGVLAARGTVWSPDGARVAFGAQTSLSGSWLYSVKVDGSGLRQLGSTQVGWWNGGPAWSPDGRWLATSARSDGPGGSVVLTSADGRARREFASGAGWSPSWSPDARYVAYVRFPAYRGDRDGGVSIVDVAMVTSRTVASGDGEVAWSPG